MYDANIMGNSHFNFILGASAYAMFLVSAGLVAANLSTVVKASGNAAP